MANNLRHLVLILGAGLLASSASAFDEYKQFNRDHWDFEASGEYFSSQANYDSSSSQSSLPSGNSFTLMSFDLGTRYIPSSRWSAFGTLNIADAQSKNSVATRNNSTINAALVGLDFIAYSGVVELVPEISMYLPFQQQNFNSDDVPNSENVVETIARITMQKDFGSTLGYSYVGADYRGDGRSALLPWGVGGELKFGQGSRLGLEIYGFHTIVNDTDTNNATYRQAYTSTVLAGSDYFDSLNPSLVDSKAYLRFKLNKKWTFQIDGGATLGGTNEAAGFHGGALVRYSFDMSEGYVQPPQNQAPAYAPVPNSRSNLHLHEDSTLSSDKKVQKFHDDTYDGVDQTQFRPQPTRRPRVNQQQLQQQNEDSDFSVQLKSQKSQ